MSEYAFDLNTYDLDAKHRITVTESLHTLFPAQEVVICWSKQCKRLEDGRLLSAYNVVRNLVDRYLQLGVDRQLALVDERSIYLHPTTDKLSEQEIRAWHMKESKQICVTRDIRFTRNSNKTTTMSVRIKFKQATLFANRKILRVVNAQRATRKQHALPPDTKFFYLQVASHTTTCVNSLKHNALCMAADCFKPMTTTCIQCKQAHYCSQACQTLDFKQRHQWECKIGTADYKKEERCCASCTARDGQRSEYSGLESPSEVARLNKMMLCPSADLDKLKSQVVVMYDEKTKCLATIGMNSCFANHPNLFWMTDADNPVRLAFVEEIFLKFIATYVIKYEAQKTVYVPIQAGCFYKVILGDEGTGVTALFECESVSRKSVKDKLMAWDKLAAHEPSEFLLKLTTHLPWF